jgi:para-nitrobenzyl esterase
MSQKTTSPRTTVRLRRLSIAVVRCAMLATVTLGVATSNSAVAAPACDAGTVVQTTSGPVCGIVVNGVTEWLGIPYAAPPVGSLRWAPPQAPAPWSATLATTAYASSCTQASGGSEDCLYLNVYAPAGAMGLPVMAHIHGGGFRGGSGQGDYTLLATTGNEVVVSLNYRLNIFGFLAHAALGKNSGDYGLQDQQAALRWVQANIRAFGGDPHSVTIFGESAGGSSVCDQIASPTAAGLFHKAISTSGEYNTILDTPEAPGPFGTTLELQDCKSPLPTLAEAKSAGANFATAVGCGGAADVAACIRAVPTATVFSVAGLGYHYGGQGTIAPTLNGTTLTMTLRQALRSGSVNRVPVIAGVDRDENLAGTPVTAADYTQIVDAQFGSIAAEVLARYPLNRFYSPYVAWRTVTADAYTVCSALRTAEELSRWMPVFEYEIDFGDVSSATSGNPTGASHVGQWNLTPVAAGLDVNRQVLQNQELLYVTTLARTGAPTADGTPIWPQFKAEGENEEQPRMVMSLGAGADSQKTLVAQIRLVHNCAFWDEVTPEP